MIESLTIETSTVCNASCIICPNRKNRRLPYIMRIVELKEILQSFPDLKGVVLCGMYEPLSDSRIDSILSLIEKVQPAADITIFSNGSLLNTEIAEILLSHKNLKNVVFSVHGYSTKVYESIMCGLNRATVYNNILNFVSIAKSLPNRPHISVSFVRTKQNIHELQAFREFWSQEVDTVSDFEVMNWRGQVDQNDLLYEIPKYTRPCPMYEHPLVINAHGSIVRCCYDFTYGYGHVLFGGLERWKNKTRVSDTYPTNDCKQCLGWKHY